MPKLALHQCVDGSPQISEASPEFAAEADVIVLGLGTAGAVAAIVAGRAGCSVIGLEQQTSMGGVGTAGGINGYYMGTAGGIQREIDRATKELGEQYAKTGGFHPDAKKLVLERMASAAQVDIRYEHQLVGVYRVGSRVVGVRVLGPFGIADLACKVLIDASGDAHAVALAGGRVVIGRGSDGTCQPYSAPRTVIEDDDTGRVGSLNFDAGYVDPSSAWDYSRATIAGHAQHLRERYEASQRLVLVVPHLGVREGRFIEGEARVSFEDLVERRHVEQPVSMAAANHDIHSIDWAFESELAEEWMTVAALWGRALYAEIPYGALLPRGLAGVLVAGRCIALDHDSSQALRMQRDMQKLGEVAGQAAAIAAKNGCSPSEVPYDELLARLRASGCFHGAKERADTAAERDAWQSDVGAIRSGLASDAPGVAIWSCRRLGRAVQEQLCEWARGGEEPLFRHAALALGLTQHPAAIEPLRRIVAERDSVSHGDARSRSPRRLHAAVFLLGRLGAAEATGDIIALLEAQATLRDVSYASMALLRIGDRHAHLRPRLAAELRRHVLERDLCLIERMHSVFPENAHPHDFTTMVRGIVTRRLAAWDAPHGAVAGSAHGTERPLELA
jgi:hypothetical protein